MRNFARAILSILVAGTLALVAQPSANAVTYSPSGATRIDLVLNQSTLPYSGAQFTGWTVYTLTVGYNPPANIQMNVRVFNPYNNAQYDYGEQDCFNATSCEYNGVQGGNYGFLDVCASVTVESYVNGYRYTDSAKECRYPTGGPA